MSQPRLQPKGRFDALDTLRFLAVLVMVQGHAFYVTLTQVEREAPWYSWHNYIHGYTAPAFLFGAGLAFGYTTLTDKIGQHAEPGPTLYKRLYRYLSLFAIGYAIQLPPLGVATKYWAESSVRVFLRVEALQHIGAALLFVQLLVVWLKRPLPVLLSTMVVGTVVVLTGPALSRLPASYWGSDALAAYMSLDSGSTFPLIPWAGFVMAGVAVGAIVYRQRKVRSPWTLASAFVVAGGAFVATSLGLDVMFPEAFGEHFYWKTSPYFFLRRLGWVLVAIGVLAAGDCLWQRFSRSQEPGRIRHWVRLISQHSLVVYVAHLVVLYGSPISPGIYRSVSHRLDLLSSTAVVVGLFALLALLLVAWERVEQRFGQGFVQFRRASVGVMAAASLVAAVRTAGFVAPPSKTQPVLAEAAEVSEPAEEPELEALPAEEGELAEGDVGQVPDSDPQVSGVPLSALK